MGKQHKKANKRGKEIFRVTREEDFISRKHTLIFFAKGWYAHTHGYSQWKWDGKHMLFYHPDRPQQGWTEMESEYTEGYKQWVIDCFEKHILNSETKENKKGE